MPEGFLPVLKSRDGRILTVDLGENRKSRTHKIATRWATVGAESWYGDLNPQELYSKIDQLQPKTISNYHVNVKFFTPRIWCLFGSEHREDVRVCSYLADKDSKTIHEAAKQRGDR